MKVDMSPAAVTPAFIAFPSFATCACGSAKRALRRAGRVSCRLSNRPPPRPEPIRDRAERVRVVTDDEPPSGPEEREDVVADFAVMWMAGQISRSQADDLQFLAAIDSVDAIAGGNALPRLHFDEDEHSSAPNDQIDLAATHVEVALHDAISTQPVEPGGAPLTAFSE